MHDLLVLPRLATHEKRFITKKNTILNLYEIHFLLVALELHIGESMIRCYSSKAKKKYLKLIHLTNEKVNEKRSFSDKHELILNKKLKINFNVFGK